MDTFALYDTRTVTEDLFTVRIIDYYSGKDMAVCTCDYNTVRKLIKSSRSNIIIEGNNFNGKKIDN